MQSFLSKFILIGFSAVLLAGCERDVNLADDVDLLVKTSPAAAIPQAPSMQQPKMPQQQRQAPVPTPPPQPPPPTAAPTTAANAEEATVQASTTELYAEIVTSAGKIKIKLLPKEAPNTVKNFLAKVRSDFYSGLTFHRVENWVIQGGDPLGTGKGGGSMPTELSQTPFKEGSVGVARGGDILVSNDSQFFICIADCSWLTGQYTLFGEVVEGMEIAKQVSVGITIDEIVEVSD